MYDRIIPTLTVLLAASIAALAVQSVSDQQERPYVPTQEEQEALLEWSKDLLREGRDLCYRIAPAAGLDPHVECALEDNTGL